VDFLLNGLLILTKLNYFQKFFNKALSRFSGMSGQQKNTLEQGFYFMNGYVSELKTK